MATYVPNRTCPCMRCRAQYTFGPVIIITIGVLFMIDTASRQIGFGELWPILLIVIGGMKVLQSAGSAEGHREPQFAAPPAPPPAPPPPPDAVGPSEPQSSSSQVQHG